MVEKYWCRPDRCGPLTLAQKPPTTDKSEGSYTEPPPSARFAAASAAAPLGSGLAMEQYRRRLEKICVLLLVPLFGGLLTLLWVGQVIWIAVIMAIYIRVIFVIARKEELLEELDPMRETTKCSPWYDSRQRRVVISDSYRTWVLGVDAHPTKCIEIKPTLLKKRSTPPAHRTHRRITFDQ